MCEAVHPFTLTIGGAPVKGQAFVPATGGDRGTGLIISHGIPSGITPQNPERHGYDYLGRFFSRRGFTTLIFNFRGTGSSGGNLDLVNWTEDLREVINYYVHTYGTPSPDLILMGFSAGAAVSVEVAVGDRRVKALALGACPQNFVFFADRLPAADLWGWFKAAGMFRQPESLPTPEKWITRLLSICPEDKVAQLAPRRLLIMHGDEDEVVPCTHAEELYRRAGKGINRRLVLFPGVGHQLRVSRRVWRYLAHWLKETEKEAP